MGQSRKRQTFVAVVISSPPFPRHILPGQHPMCGMPHVLYFLLLFLILVQVQMIVLQGSTPPAQRATLQAYARRVRVLRLFGPEVFCPQPSVLSLCSRPITISLRVLDIGPVGAAVYDLLHLYLSPSIEILSLDMASSERLSAPLLDVILRTCFLLVDLTLRAYSLDIASSARLCSRTSRLVRFRCDNMDLHAFALLSALPRLTFLAFTLNPPFSRYRPRVLHHALFTALETLEITVGHIPPLTDLLTVASFPRLRHLTVWTHDTLFPLEVDLFQTLLRACEPTVLSNISFHQHISPTPRAVLQCALTLSIDHFSPLFQCNNLVVLCFDCPNVEFHLTDSDVRLMASAWPALEVLSLGSRGWLNSSQLTIRSLFSLVHFCPRLSTISLVLDATHLSDFDHLPTVSPNFAVHTLSLGTSRIGPIGDAVAGALFALFPRLSSVVAWAGTHAIGPLPLDSGFVNGNATQRLLWSTRWASAMISVIHAQLSAVDPPATFHHHSNPLRL